MDYRRNPSSCAITINRLRKGRDNLCANSIYLQSLHFFYCFEWLITISFVSDTASLDTWSIVWYIASFGGLILFFLIVSCSEWCCRRNARRGCQRQNAQTAVPVVPDTPPPSYDQFAPPSYEELWVGGSRQAKCEKTEYDVYVVPVHALGPIIETARNEDSPPSYQTSAGLADVSQLPRLHSYNASTSLTWNTTWCLDDTILIYYQANLSYPSFRIIVMNISLRRISCFCSCTSSRQLQLLSVTINVNTH